MSISPHVANPLFPFLPSSLFFMSTIYLVFRIPHFSICHLPHFLSFCDCVFGRKLSVFSLRECFWCVTFSKYPVPISSLYVLLWNFCFCLVSRWKNIFPSFQNVIATAQICPNLPRQRCIGITPHPTCSTVHYTISAPSFGASRGRPCVTSLLAWLQHFVT